MAYWRKVRVNLPFDDSPDSATELLAVLSTREGGSRLALIGLLDRNEALSALKDGTYRHRLDASLDEGRRLMISAVPTFIFSDPRP